MIGFDGWWKPIMRFLKFCSLFLCLSPLLQARLNCKHCGKPVIDVRIGMQYFSEYSNVQQCPHCGNLDYHFVKPFSSFKVLEAYWQKLCHSNSYFMSIVPFILHIFYKICSVKGRGAFFLIERKVQQALRGYVHVFLCRCVSFRQRSSCHDFSEGWRCSTIFFSLYISYYPSSFPDVLGSHCLGILKKMFHHIWEIVYIHPGWRENSILFAPFIVKWNSDFKFFVGWRDEQIFINM